MGTRSVAAGVSEWSQAAGKSNGRTNEEVSQTHRHRDPRWRTSLWSFKSTRGLKQLPRPTHSWLETSMFSLFCSSFPLADSTIPPTHSFATLPVPFPLYLSYLTNCCWSSVFCVAREIFQYVLWRTMLGLSHKKSNLEDMEWTLLTFQLMARVLLSPVLCWDVIPTLTWHAVFTDAL